MATWHSDAWGEMLAGSLHGAHDYRAFSVVTQLHHAYKSKNASRQVSIGKNASSRDYDLVDVESLYEKLPDKLHDYIETLGSNQML